MFRRADVRNQVEGDVVGEGFVRMRFTVQLGVSSLLQVALAGDARAAGGLVRADDDARHAGGIVQRLERHDHLGRRTVGAGDDPVMLVDGLRVHLGNDQRNLGIHPPVAALIDHDAAALDGPGDEVAGHFVGRAADGEVDADEGVGHQFFDHVRLATEGDRRAGRTLRGQKLELRERKITLFE